MEGATHFDIVTEGELTSAQRLRIENIVNAMTKEPDFKGITSFYLNGEYIGGRPNDRG